MLKIPYLQSFRNASHIQFNNDVVSICEDNDPVVLKIREQLDAFKAGTVKMEDLYKLMQGSAVTVKITQEDNFRDNLIIGIEKAADAFTHHFNPDFVDAANLLLKHIRKYGQKIARMKYQEESTALNDLIDTQKNNAALNAAVTLLGLTDWFSELEASNNRFKDLYITRVKGEAEKPTETLKELRAESVDHYKELVKFITANSVLTPSDLYTKVINEINELIDKYNEKRKSGKSAGDDEADLVEELQNEPISE